jgi:hypothetical protein
MTLARWGLLLLLFHLLVTLSPIEAQSLPPGEPTAATATRHGATKASAPASGTEAQTNPASQFTLSGFEGQLVSAVDSSKPDSGDYIPCEFTLEQLLTLRPKPTVVVFGTYEEERLRATVIDEALAQNATNDFPEAAKIAFINEIALEPFIGLAPSEALARVIVDLDHAIRNASGKAAAGETGTPGPDGTQAGGQPSTTARAQVSNQPETHASSQSGMQTSSQAAGQARAKAAGVETAATAGQAGAQATAIVNSARSTISAFQRPPDIGCAMSILGWNELRYAFGQTIADEYIGVQIVVRNVNPDKEFLIHDAEISVDSDLNGRYGRFYSGQDKLVVRNFMLASRDYGRRNFIVHLAQGVGTVMSATSLIYGPGLQSATNVFNAGFLSALQTVWTDHNTDQLNLLNDVGFSASKTDRTVVPKSGTAMFVIFISSKQFRNAWWVQECANSIVLTPSGQTYPLVGGDTLQSGLDLNSLRDICVKESSVKSQPPTGTLQPVVPGSSTDERTNPQYMKPRAVPYKKWSPTAAAIFHELTLAVVAGTHFTDDTHNTPSITTITCPKDKVGNLDFSSAASGTLICDLTGQALNSVQGVTLRNGGTAATDATDIKTAEGTVSSSGDATKATVRFPLDQLGALGAPIYKVFPVTNGVEGIASAQLLHLSLEPFVVDDPTRPELHLDQLSTKGANAATITLKGFHLDKLNSVHLGNSEDAVSATDSISIDAPIKGSASAISASFDVTPAQVSKLPPGNYTEDNKLTMHIFLVSKDNPGTKTATKQMVYGVGTLAAVAAPAAAAVAPKKKGKSQPSK